MDVFPSTLPTPQFLKTTGGPILRWGILAPGEIAAAFTHTLHTNTDQRVVAVASRSKERAVAFGREFGISKTYVISRTLVPKLVMWFERGNQHGHEAKSAAGWAARPFVALQHGFARGFERFLEGYRDVLATLLNHRKVFVLVFLAFCGRLGADRVS